MLAVSAQCGCCHHSVFHFMPYLFGTFWLYYYMVILLHYNSITWICFIFFPFFALHGVCVIRIMGNAIGGGSYSAVYVPPPFNVFPMVLMLHILSFFSFLVFCVLISFTIVIPMFSSSNLCVFFHAWIENFWGVWVLMYYMQPHTGVLKWVYT